MVIDFKNYKISIFFITIIGLSIISTSISTFVFLKGDTSKWGSESGAFIIAILLDLFYTFLCTVGFIITQLVISNIKIFTIHKTRKMYPLLAGIICYGIILVFPDYPYGCLWIRFPFRGGDVLGLILQVIILAIILLLFIAIFFLLINRLRLKKIAV